MEGVLSTARALAAKSPLAVQARLELSLREQGGVAHHETSQRTFPRCPAGKPRRLVCFKKHLAVLSTRLYMSRLITLPLRPLAIPPILLPPPPSSSPAQRTPHTAQGTKATMLFSRDHSVADGLDFVAGRNAAVLYSADLAAVLSERVTKKRAVFSKL